MAATEATAPDVPVRSRGRRYRRRLRSRIILSFFLLGVGLMVLFAFATNWTRNRVENALVEDVLNRNIDAAAHEYALNPEQPVAPVAQMRAWAYPADRFDAVRRSRPGACPMAWRCAGLPRLRSCAAFSPGAAPPPGPTIASGPGGRA